MDLCDDTAGGFKRQIAQERDNLGHTGDKLWFTGCDLTSQLTLRFPTGEKFECRAVYVYDRSKQNGTPISTSASHLATASCVAPSNSLSCHPALIVPNRRQTPWRNASLGRSLLLSRETGR